MVRAMRQVGRPLPCGHPVKLEGEEAEGDGEGNVAFDELDVDDDDPPPPTGAFARLHVAGLI